MSNDRRALKILCGAVVAWLGAVIGKWLITEPAFMWGVDLRMFLPNPGAILWLIGGIVISLVPKEGDSEGEGARRVTKYVVGVIAASIGYYVVAIGSYLGPKSTVLPFIQGYSTGTFKPHGGPWFFAMAIFAVALLFPILAIVFPGLAKTGGRRDVVVRGRTLISYGEAQKRATRKVKEEGSGLFFGMVNLPDRVATSHFLVTGTTGAGKTTILRLLMQSVLPKIGNGDTRALIYDAKQDILSLLHGMGTTKRIVTLNPFDERCAGWAMAKDVTSPTVAEQIATILIPNEKNSSNPYFAQAARSLLTGVMIAFMLTCPGKWTFADVLNAFRSVETLKSILGSCTQTAYLVERYFSNERTANDVMSTLDTKLRPYQYVAAAWSRASESISLSEWLSDEYVLVLGNDEEARSPIDAINQVIFKRLSELVIAQSESRSRRTWFFLDELKEAGRLEGLTSLLTKGRSKGACVVLGFQDIEGLSVTYGDNRAAREIVGLCANKAILRTDSPDTAQWASSLFGSREILEYRITESSGESGAGKQTTKTESEQLQKRETILPAQLMSIPPSGPDNGLCGYYLIPEVGGYRADIEWDWIERNLRSPDSSVANVVKRPSEHQYLAAWDKADYQRLRIDSKTEQAKQPEIDVSQAQGLLVNINR